jgi:hypothetical protein
MSSTTKLPKWAQDHISDLQRQRDSAVREFNRYIDDQTPSPFSIMEMAHTGEHGGGPSFKRRYIQTNKVEIGHGDSRYEVILWDGKLQLRVIEGGQLGLFCEASNVIEFRSVGR